MFTHERQPGHNLVREKLVARIQRSPPLSDKERKSGINRLFRFGHEFFPVASGIEMQGVHDVRLTGNGILCGLVHILTPGGRSDDNDVVGVIFPYLGDYFFSVGFNLTAPGNMIAVRFIADFIDDVGIRTICLCHFGKELKRFFLVRIRI